jgi:hypothetical protein
MVLHQLGDEILKANASRSRARARSDSRDRVVERIGIAGIRQRHCVFVNIGCQLRSASGGDK